MYASGKKNFPKISSEMYIPLMHLHIPKISKKILSFCVRLLFVRRTLHLFSALGIIGSAIRNLSLQMVLAETP